MKPWDWDERFLRYLAVLLCSCFISLLVKDDVWALTQKHILRIASGASVWGSVVVALAAAFVCWAALTWRIAPKARPIVQWIVRMTYMAEWGLALLFRFWGWGTIWSLVWFFVSVVTVLLLTAKESQPHDTQTKGKAVFVVDRPADKDGLDRDCLAEALSRCIDDHTLPYAYTVGLYGGWGTGKTTLMKALKKRLEAKHKVIWVNAWLYDSKQGIWTAFIKALMASLRKHDVTILPNMALRRYYKMAAEILKATGEHGLSTKAFWAVYDKIPTNDDFTAAKDEVGDLIDKLVAGNRLVVFFDDLDRCNPDSVVGTLEFLKEVADFRHCVFILGIDQESVIDVLRDRYKTKGEEFLQKVINVAVDLNVPASDRLVTLYVDRLKAVELLPAGELESEMAHIIQFTGANPRLISQLLNSVIVLKSIVKPILGNELDPRMLIDGELLRLKHQHVYRRLKIPMVYRRLYDDIAGRKSDEQVVRKAVQGFLGVQGREQDEVALLISRTILRNEPESLPLILLFGYVAPPDVAPLSLRKEMQARIIADPKTTFSVLKSLNEVSNARLQTFVSWMISEKNAHLRLLRPDRQAYITENERYRYFVRETMRFQIETHADVLTGLALQSIAAGELEHLQSASAEAFLVELLRFPWPLSTIHALALRDVQTTFAHPLSNKLKQCLDEMRDRVCYESWQVVRAALSGDHIDSPDYIIDSVLDLETDVLLRPSVHKELLDDAHKFASSELWASNFKVFLDLLGKRLSTNPLPSPFIDRWLSACQAGLLDTLRKVKDLISTRQGGDTQELWGLLSAVEQKSTAIHAGRSFPDK